MNRLAPFLQAAKARDAADPLAPFRERFIVDDLLYLDGNSLGRLPKATAERMRDLVEHQWGERLIRGWGEDWMTLPRRLGGKIAPLIGAQADEVIVCDSTSVDFYKLAYAALAATERRTVVSNGSNFPSDLYLLQGLGVDLRCLDTEDDDTIAAALDENVALLTLSHVEFKSGRRHDLAKLTTAAHRVGARVLWDLSHSVGAVPIDLGEADLAVGCGYKYLNGGPGAPAFLYVRRDLQSTLKSPIQGWFGAGGAFQFALDYTPAAGIDRFLAGTPPILSMAALEPGLDIVLEAGIDRIAEKAAAQTGFLMELADDRLTPLGFQVATPRDPSQRGSHLALRHPEAWRIAQALVAEQDLIPDFRTPDVLRLGVAPLYTRWTDLVEATERIASVVESKSFETYESKIEGVT